jgi:hypothetical protein
VDNSVRSRTPKISFNYSTAALGNMADKGLLDVIQEGKGKWPTIYLFTGLNSIIIGERDKPLIYTNTHE